MNKAIDHTIEFVAGAEVGNLASIHGLKHDEADYGIITSVSGDEVVVAWFKKVKKHRRSHQENKKNAAITRILHQAELDAALA